MAYDLYPAVDPTYNFPVEIRRALAASLELRSLVIPMTTTTRNNLSAAEKWDGRVIANTTTDRLERYDLGTSTWNPIYEKADAAAYVGSVVSGRNRFINGDFSVCQRTFNSITGTGSYQWGFDRWLLQAAGGTVTYTPLLLNNGDLPESPKKALRMVTAGMTGAGGWARIEQRIESVGTLSGKKVTVSFWARANAAFKIGIQLEQFFGTTSGASTSVKIFDTSITIGTAWARYSAVITLPSIAGKVIMDHLETYLGVGLYTAAGSGIAGLSPIGLQNGTFDFWGIQIEEGDVATVFEQKSPAAQLLDCQRYFCYVGDPAGVNGQMLTGTGQAQNTTRAFSQFVYPVRMRKTPNLTFAGNFMWSDRATNINLTNVFMAATTSSNVHADLACDAVGLTAGKAGSIFGGPGAQLFFNAEL